jgi:hypothetical protein
VDVRAWTRRHGRAVAAGIGVGAAASLAFLTLHAVLVRPIWGVGVPRALLVSLVGGGIVGAVYDRWRRSLRGGPAVRSTTWGLAVAALPVPFALAGALRTAGSPGWVWAPVLLAALAPVALLAWLAGSPSSASWRPRWVSLTAVAVGLNAYPMGFLLVLGNLVTDRVPNPWPMVSVLGAVYVAAAWALEAALGSRPVVSAARPATA